MLTQEDLNAKSVYARGCTGLTHLDVPNAGYVYASGCTGLTELDAPNAEIVYASGCTGLTELQEALQSGDWKEIVGQILAPKQADEKEQEGKPDESTL